MTAHHQYENPFAKHCLRADYGHYAMRSCESIAGGYSFVVVPNPFDPNTFLDNVQEPTARDGSSASHI